MQEPFHKEMLEVIVRASELERVSADHVLTALVAGVQLSQGKVVMEELARQNTLLLGLIEQQRNLMGGEEEEEGGGREGGRRRGEGGRKRRERGRKVEGGREGGRGSGLGVIFACTQMLRG